MTVGALRGISARCVDAAAKSVTEFNNPTQVHIATALDQVCGVLHAAQEASRAGRWVVGFVSYEAAPAFDPAMSAKQYDGIVPLACFVEFAGCTTSEWNVDHAASEAPLASFDRLGGSSWFQQGVETIRDRIRNGDVYQVNLTDRCRLSSAVQLDSIFGQLVAAQGSSSNWSINLDSLAIASASPEMFFDLNEGVITTRPMKGTARRAPRSAEDSLAGDALRDSDKDRAENVMIVDLLRNDLSRLSVAGGVSVPRILQLERYGTLWQLTSTVQAVVREGVTLVDIFTALFPCGSVTGAPKIAAMRVIDELEPWPRGVYCGAIGVIEPAHLNSAALTCRFDVAIRTAVIDTVGSAVYGSGGGITWDSTPAGEDAEMVMKTAVLTAQHRPFGLLETLLLDASGPRHLADHIRRMQDSAAYFGFDVDADVIAAAVGNLDPVQHEMRLRMVVHRDGRVELDVRPLDVQPSVVRLAVSPLRLNSNDPMRCHKTTDRRFYEQARAASAVADDVVLINERNEVVETSIASLLYNWQGRWFTPPLASGGIDGIGRRRAIDAGQVTERTLLVDQLATCTELATVSSLRGWRRAVLQWEQPR